MIIAMAMAIDAHSKLERHLATLSQLVTVIFFVLLRRTGWRRQTFFFFPHWKIMQKGVQRFLTPARGLLPQR